MSIWSRFIGIKKTEEKSNAIGHQTTSVSRSASNYAMVDVEVGLKDHKIHDIGALKHDDTTFHQTSKEELFVFLKDIDYVCGHNIIHHDAKYLFKDQTHRWMLVDTLYVSPLLFPERPYHRLVKDDKLVSEQMNNPVNDCKKAKDLLLDEMARWDSLPKGKRVLFASLLKDKEEFEGFLSMVGATYIQEGIAALIKELYAELIGNAAHFVEIKTFHSYCFDLLGRIGNLEDAKNVVAKAAGMINQEEVEPNRIGKTVLVIDEAQDMGAEEYALVKALMDNNEEMRVIAVGDDDQNIYEFRGADSGYMYRLAQESGSTFIEMTENYRSAHHPVDFANGFLKAIGNRMKSTPIISMRKEEGWVEVTRHQS